MTTVDLSVEEVAAELGMHRETIRRFLKTSELPGYRAGGHWRVTRAALDGWKAAGGVRRQGRPRTKAGLKAGLEDGAGEGSL